MVDCIYSYSNQIQPASIPSGEGDDDDADENEAAEKEHHDDESGVGVDDLTIRCGTAYCFEECQGSHDMVDFCVRIFKDTGWVGPKGRA